MRTRNHNLIGCLCIATALLFSNCSNWLDEMPISTITDDQAWENGSDAEGSIAAAFAIFRRALSGLTADDTPSTTRNGSWGDYYFWGDARSGDWITPNNDGDWQAGFENRLIERTQLEPMTNWRLYYRVIEQCNLAIENIPTISIDITMERKEQLIAEARFLRAMSHFYAMRIWGDVPINLTARNVEALGRNTMEEVLDMIISETSDIVDLLPVHYTYETGEIDLVTSRTRGTRGAALSLLAHASMWQKNYQEASNYISELIKLFEYQLVPTESFRSMFDEGGSEEMIFELFYDNELGEYSNYYGHILTYYLTNPYSSRSNLSLAVPRSKILEIYPEYASSSTDKRVGLFFESIDFSVSSSEIRPVFDDPLQNGEREIMFAKFRKDKDRSYNYMDANVPVFRYAGLLLLKAEADARLGNVSEALTNLNLIKSRAGIAEYTRDDQNSVIEEVLEERRRELIGEYHRVYDLVRLGRLHEFNEFITEEDEAIGAGFFPVSEEAFVNNPNMEQNLYWQFNQ